MGASSFSPSPITTTPSIDTVSSSSRMASTAAPSAPSLSPLPTQRAHARAAYSVVRTSSSARLRSGRWPVSADAPAVVAIRAASGQATLRSRQTDERRAEVALLEDPGGLSRVGVDGLAQVSGGEHARASKQAHEVPVAQRDLDARVGLAQDDPVAQD